MDFQKLRNLTFLLSIWIIVSEAKGNNWSQQNGMKWPSEANQENLIGNQVVPSSGNSRNSQTDNSWNSGGNVQRWSPGDSQVKDGGNWNDLRNPKDRGGWGPGDNQVKDSERWSGNEQVGPGWIPGDAQTKETGRWNSDGNQQNGNGWGPNDSQVKDGRHGIVDGSQGSGGSWGPSDSQVKDSGRWNAEGNQPSKGNFGPTDSQVKDPNSWNDGGNQKPPGQFEPSDSQEKIPVPGSWESDRNQNRPGSWGPTDTQVKDADWSTDGNKQMGGENWGPGKDQMKIDDGWNRDGNQGPSGGMWSQNPGSNENWNGDNRGTGDNNGDFGSGPKADGNYEPNQGVGQPGGSDWPRNQGPGNEGINSGPSVGQGQTGDGTVGDTNNQDGTGDGNYDSDNNQSGGVGNTGEGGLTGGDRGDAGVIPDLFPPRVPQGNYKGGDTNAYPGDDPSQWRLEDSIPGTPGVDYPNYSTIPATGFDCKQHENPGYYGDVEAQCQVFHICQSDGRHDAFLCPLGTIFNQQYFVCVWWFNYNCEDTEMYYNLNADLYKGGHGAQGNFKGDTYRGGGTSGASDSTYTTPQPDIARGVGDSGRSDYGTAPGLTGGQVASIIPPETGVNNVGSNELGFSGGQGGHPVVPERPNINPPGSWDGTGNEYGQGPGIAVIVGEGGGQGTNYEQNNGNWRQDSIRPEDRFGKEPDSGVAPQGTDYGQNGANRPGTQGNDYGQGGAIRPESQGTDYGQSGVDLSGIQGGQGDDNGQNGGNWRQDNGKRNWVDQPGQRNWESGRGPGVDNKEDGWSKKGGRPGGGGRWNGEGNWGKGGDFDRGVKGENSESTSGVVKGRKARSWGSGEQYGNGLEKRWGSDSDVSGGGQQTRWISLEDVAPNQETFGVEEQNGNWRNNFGQFDERKESVDTPQEFVHRGSWESRNQALNPASSVDVPQEFVQRGSRENKNEELRTDGWSSREASREEIDNYVEGIEAIPRDLGRIWRTIEIPSDTTESKNRSEKGVKKNWWRDSLSESVDDHKEKRNEDLKKSDGNWNNSQEIKDTPHIYGGWRTLNNYFDHNKDYNSRDDPSQRNWTK